VGVCVGVCVCVCLCAPYLVDLIIITATQEMDKENPMFEVDHVQDSAPTSRSNTGSTRSGANALRSTATLKMPGQEGDC
jgi:hypothetical protein